MPTDTPQKTPGDEMFAALYEVAKGSIARARAGAEFIEKAAAAIATVYTGALALVFSVSENPLPLRGIIPAVFLGLALTFAVFYLAFPKESAPQRIPRESDAPREAWFNAFAAWISDLVLVRANFLRAGLAALLFAVLFLPAPFVRVETQPPNPPKPLEWPKAPSSNIAFQKVLYSAQVAEAAKLREKASPEPVGEFTVKEKYVWYSAFAALTIVFAILLFSRSRFPRSGGGVVVGIPLAVPLGGILRGIAMSIPWGQERTRGGQ